LSTLIAVVPRVSRSPEPSTIWVLVAGTLLASGTTQRMTSIDDLHETHHELLHFTAFASICIRLALLERLHDFNSES
jgi:hypothetical protein